VSLCEITSNCLVFEKDHNKDFKTIFALLKSIAFQKMMNEEQIDEGVISSEEINRCIAILSQLNTDTDQIFDIPKEEQP
jgi:hypothetical protein